MSQSLLIQ